MKKTNQMVFTHKTHIQELGVTMAILKMVVGFIEHVKVLEIGMEGI